jgi:hypothetical protein
MKTTIEQIHESIVNGQRKQAVKQMEDYGMYDFFEDYAEYLYSMYALTAAFEYLKDASSSYFRIKNR